MQVAGRGRAWAPAEDAELTRRVGQWPYWRIARHLGRSTMAICGRVCRLRLCAISADDDPEEYIARPARAARVDCYRTYLETQQMRLGGDYGQLPDDAPGLPKLPGDAPPNGVYMKFVRLLCEETP